MKCANCGKGVLYGHNVSHSKRRTQKIFKPNLHAARVIIGGNRRRVKLCTKCLRMYRKMEAITAQTSQAVTEAAEKTPQASV